MDQPPAVSAVILAGGRASRMQGEDKGLLELDGTPLVEYVIRALRPQVGEILINANRNRELYRGFGLPVISDSVPDFAGPLAGMLAALQQLPADYLLCVPCDSPWLPADLGERLLSGLLAAQAEISCVHDGERLHPVFALLRRELREPLAAYLAEGGRAVHRWFTSRRLARVDFSDCPGCFANINTPEDLSGATAGPARPGDR